MTDEPALVTASLDPRRPWARGRARRAPRPSRPRRPAGAARSPHDGWSGSTLTCSTGAIAGSSSSGPRRRRDWIVRATRDDELREAWFADALGVSRPDGSWIRLASPYSGARPTVTAPRSSCRTCPAELIAWERPGAHPAIPEGLLTGVLDGRRAAPRRRPADVGQRDHPVVPRRRADHAADADRRPTVPGTRRTPSRPGSWPAGMRSTGSPPRLRRRLVASLAADPAPLVAALDALPADPAPRRPEAVERGVDGRRDRRSSTGSSRRTVRSRSSSAGSSSRTSPSCRPVRTPCSTATDELLLVVADEVGLDPGVEPLGRAGRPGGRSSASSCAAGGRASTPKPD